MKARTFVDTVLVHVSGGDGGRGCVSFRREKYVPYGGPDGGDGGRGGNVVLKASRNEDSLVRLFYDPHLRAEHGEHGRGAQQHGRNGRDAVALVPLGTVAQIEGDEASLGEVVEDGQELVVARGGRGGLGNVHWKSSTNQAPRQYTPGTKGERLDLRVTLKLIADAGLIGYPNAGKSSILSQLTDARPKVAAYPFTTLHPILGAMPVDDYRQMRVADIPGIVAGAHDGVGLGLDFLRHIERVPTLVHVVDMAGTDGRDPVSDFRTVRDELKRYRADLPARVTIVVANKMDVPGAAANLAAFRRRTRVKPVPISALTGEGIADLKAAMVRAWDKPSRRN